MAQPSIGPALQVALDIYVEMKAQQWAQHQKLLPATNDGKINAKGVIAEMIALGIKLTSGAGHARCRELEPHHVQHLHKKPELAVKLNALGQHQGLKPLGERSNAECEPESLQETLVTLLNELHEAYLHQPEVARRPTLPLDPIGNVCLGALAGLLSDRSHGIGRPAIFRCLHQENGLASEIGLIASQQGVYLPVAALSPGDESVRQRIASLARTAAQDARTATSSRLAERKLREELDSANKLIQQLSAQVESLNTQIGLMRSGIFVRGLE